MVEDKKMKPTIRLKTTFDNGVIQTVELFKYKHGIVLHRHELTKDKERAEMLGVKRTVGSSYYCMQELMLMNDEIFDLLKIIETNK